MKNGLKLAAGLALVASAFALLGRAQSSASETRSVSGVVRSASGEPVPGAVVQIEDTKTLQVRSFVTQEGGKYHFASLSTNVAYEIRASFRGASSKTKTLSEFNGAKEPVVDLKLGKPAS